jgi:hypothetical protein
MAAQLLHRPHRKAPEAVVRHLLGVQAQVLSSAELALSARAEGLTRRSVEAARENDRSIVLTWAMRGTLHLLATEDYGWLVPLVIEPRLATATRRLQQEGFAANQVPKAMSAIARMVERDGPLSRSHIAERLRDRGIRTEGQAIAHLIWLASARGIVCYGPDQGGDRRFVLLRDWLGEPEPMDRDSALAELAVRYVRAHGPAVPSDLALWSGLRMPDVNRAWRAVGPRLDEREASGRTLWTLRSGADVAQSGLVRLLPSFDEYLLGWKDRAFAVPPEHWRKINRGGGWLHPVVLADGRAVATWRPERASTRTVLRIDPFDPLSPRVRARITTEGERVARFLGTSFAASPQYRGETNV